MERIGAAYGAGELPLSVAGSPRFRVYDVDLGFGRPAKVHVASVAKTGAISAAEERGGGGGMEVGIGLSPGSTVRFRGCVGDAMSALKAAETQPTDVT